MNTNPVLIDAFRAVEHLHARLPPGTPASADQAKERILARLKEASAASDIQEFRCPTENDWETLVLHALLKRYGIKSYRSRKQRRTTIMVQLSRQFMNDVLWPIFQHMRRELNECFGAVTAGLLPAIAVGPYQLAILHHDHLDGNLCESCKKLLEEQKQMA